MTEFTEGINTYRIVPIILQDRDADTFIKKLKTKLLCGRKITKEAIPVTQNELRQIEAVIYAMADKFLEPMDMKEIEAAIRMTRLGQMLVDTEKLEEANVIRKSVLFPYFDAVCLSYEQGVQKPDVEIFKRCMVSVG